MKLCPMLASGKEVAQCLEAECAWWDNGSKCCVIATGAAALVTVAMIIQTKEEKEFADRKGVSA